jgi:predicted Rossmann fold nucleotide-binding protein DprA/Smf involved in DNA uptake
MTERANLARVKAMADAFSEERLRWLIGKGDVQVQRGDLTEEKFKELTKMAITEEFERNYIMQHLSNGPATVKEIAKTTKMEPHRVLWNLLAMMKWNRVEIVGDRKREYVFSMIEALDAKTESTK